MLQKKRWVKRPYIVWRKRCSYCSSLFCCQFPCRKHRFQHKQVSSLSHDIFHFSTIFSPNIFPNPQIRLCKTKTKLKTHLLFSHFRHEGFPVDRLLKKKNFLTRSKSFCFFAYPRILQFSWSKTLLNERYFRKIHFPTIAVPAFRSINFIIRAFFRRSSFGLGRLQNAGSTRPRVIIEFFLFFFISSILHVQEESKIKSSYWLHLDVKKVGPASHWYDDRKNANRYDRPEKLRTASHLWV